MADRVHPRDSPARSPAAESEPQSPTKVNHPSEDKPVPPPGTYVIQIPKDQVYHVPPPENAAKFKHYNKKKPHHKRSCCRRFCCFLFNVFVITVFLVGLAAAIFYFTVKPEAPNYAVTGIAINGLNLTSSSPLSPKIDVTVKAVNGNEKIGIYYDSGSSVALYYSELKLCDGALPVFYQPPKNETVFTVTLIGSGIVLTKQAHQNLVTAQNMGNVPLKLAIRVPIELKIGEFKTWKIGVNVRCDLTVDKLTSAAQIETEDCHYGVDLFA